VNVDREVEMGLYVVVLFVVPCWQLLADMTHAHVRWNSEFQRLDAMVQFGREKYRI
jgi:hypothetical protein